MKATVLEDTQHLFLLQAVEILLGGFGTRTMRLRVQDRGPSCARALPTHPPNIVGVVQYFIFFV